MSFDTTDPEFKAALDDAIKSKHKGLVDNHDKALAQLATMRARLAEFDDLDPAEFRTLREEKTKREADDLLARGEFDKLTTSLKRQHADEIGKRDAREKQLRDALSAHLIDATATSAISNEDGITKLLLPHVKSRLRVTETDGQYGVEVLGDDGQPLQGKTITDLVKAMKGDRDYASAFRSGQKAGSGARPGSEVNGSEDNPYKAGASFSMTAQAQIERANPTRAQQMRQEAGLH